MINSVNFNGQKEKTLQKIYSDLTIDKLINLPDKTDITVLLYYSYEIGRNFACLERVSIYLANGKKPDDYWFNPKTEITTVLISRNFKALEFKQAYDETTKTIDLDKVFKVHETADPVFLYNTSLRHKLFED